MKICKFTKAELDFFRQACNFTEVEAYCFEAKAKDKSDIQICMDLNVSKPYVAVLMRGVRDKMNSVLMQKMKKDTAPTAASDPANPVYHTMEEWARIPDFLSNKGIIYVYADYRTETNADGEEINIARIKIGDGINPVSKLPFITMSITEDDMKYWDTKPDRSNNNFGKIIYIDSRFAGEVQFTFPTDGYIMLEFDSADDEAKVNIFGASGESFFIFEKRKGIDIHSKEVFVKKGMKCRYINSSSGAKIKFVPLI